MATGSDLSQEEIDPSDFAVEVSSATQQEATMTDAGMVAGLSDQQLRESIKRLEDIGGSVRNKFRGRVVLFKDELRRRKFRRTTEVFKLKEGQAVSDEGSQAMGWPVLPEPSCEERERKNEEITNEKIIEKQVRCFKRIIRNFSQKVDVTRDASKKMKIIKKYIIEDFDAEDDSDADADYELQIEIAGGREKPSLKLTI